MRREIFNSLCNFVQMNHLKNLICITIVFIFFIPLVSAQNTNSLKRIANRQPSDSASIAAIIQLGEMYISINLDTSKLYLQRGLKLLQKYNFYELKTNALIYSAYLHQVEGKMETAVNMAIEAHKIAEKNNDNKLKIKTLRYLGEINRASLHYTDAIKYIKHSIELCDIENQPIEKVNGLMRLASVYFELKEYNQTIECALNAEKISNKHIINKFYIKIYEILGATYRQTENYPLALKYLLKSENLILNSSENLENATVFYHIAQTYYDLRQYDNCLKYTDIALKIANKYDVKIHQHYLLKLVAWANNAKGNYKTAYIYLDSSYNVWLALYNSQMDSRISEMQVKFDTEKTKLELKNAELEKQNIVADLNFNRIVNYLLLFSFIGSSITLAIFVISKRKLNSAYNSVVKQNIEKNEAFERLEKLKAKIENQIQIKPQTLVETKSRTKADDEDYSLIINQLEKHLSKQQAFTNPDLTLNSLAETLQTNRTYLSKAVNQHYKKNFSVFISEFRVNEACRLIKKEMHLTHTLAAIAQMCGFNNRKTFNEAFKKVVGVTPTIYIENLHNSQ